MVHFPDKTCLKSKRVVHKRDLPINFFLSIFCDANWSYGCIYIASRASFLLIFKHCACLEVFCESKWVNNLEPQPHEFSPHGPLSFMLTGSFLPCFSCFLRNFEANSFYVHSNVRGHYITLPPPEKTFLVGVAKLPNGNWIPFWAQHISLYWSLAHSNCNRTLMKCGLFLAKIMCIWYCYVKHVANLKNQMFIADV